LKINLELCKIVCIFAETLTPIPMQELKNKIATFLAFSNKPDSSLPFLEKIKKQDEMLGELNQLARKNNTLLGREIRLPMADSYALYIIIEVRKRTVVLAWVDYCDAWVDARVGYKGTISLAFAQQKVAWDDAMQARREQQIELKAEADANQ
jgi:hypothetical protein